MKKLALILLFAIALVRVDAGQTTKTVTVHIDSIDSVANKTVAESNDMQEFKEVMKTLNESGIMDHKGSDMKDIIGLAAVTSPFIAGFLIVLIILIFSHRNKKAKYELMAKALESGKELPSNFFEEEKKMKQKESPIQRAIQLIAIGIGLFILLWYIADHDVAFVAAIPFFLGVGRLVSIYFESKNKAPKSETNVEVGGDDQQNG